MKNSIFQKLLKSPVKIGVKKNQIGLNMQIPITNKINQKIEKFFKNLFYKKAK